MRIPSIIICETCKCREREEEEAQEEIAGQHQRGRKIEVCVTCSNGPAFILVHVL